MFGLWRCQILCVMNLDLYEDRLPVAGNLEVSNLIRLNYPFLLPL